ncbi:hypothetical protein CRE_24277 [Caenorhabditis remanei]|uniref:Uncharacterized protein n=1 Tax=Caenorhabditis remanei TaxID=31234 RepID=E3NJW2_CAERE|nr:hypothetical protein CRE_24277 [Caenorhabditis remanei]
MHFSPKKAICSQKLTLFDQKYSIFRKKCLIFSQKSTIFSHNLVTRTEKCGFQSTKTFIFSQKKLTVSVENLPFSAKSRHCHSKFDHFQPKITPRPTEGIDVEKIVEPRTENSIVVERARSENDTIQKLSRHSNAIVGRLEEGIKNVNDTLNLIRNRIDGIEARIDTSSPENVEAVVTQLVESLESVITGYYEDIEKLRTVQNKEAKELCLRVDGLHQRKTGYLDRLTIRLRNLRNNLEKQRQVLFRDLEECMRYVRVQTEKLSAIMDIPEKSNDLKEVIEKLKKQKEADDKEKAKGEYHVYDANSFPKVTKSVHDEHFRNRNPKYYQRNAPKFSNEFPKRSVGKRKMCMRKKSPERRDDTQRGLFDSPEPKQRKQRMLKN